MWNAGSISDEPFFEGAVEGAGINDASQLWSSTPRLPLTGANSVQYHDNYACPSLKRKRTDHHDTRLAYSQSTTHVIIPSSDRTISHVPDKIQPHPAYVHQQCSIFRSTGSLKQTDQNCLSSAQPGISADENICETRQTCESLPQRPLQISTTYAREIIDVPDLVCYGLLDEFDTVQLNFNPGQVDLYWDGHGPLKFNCGQALKLSSKPSDVLSSLVNEAGATFDFRLTDQRLPGGQPSERKRRPVDAMSAKTISVIIYGPKHAADEIGVWLDAIDLYLQLPTHCSFNVPYYNPHAMTHPTDRILMTSELTYRSRADNSEKGEEYTAYDLDALYYVRTCHEAEQPPLVRSRLYLHQLQALAFLQGRELGWDLDNDRGTNDLWLRKLDAFGREKYFLTLSKESRFKPPSEFRGGILADEMGLGKTCTMLSLIASDLPAMTSIDNQTSCPQTPTLIVVPLPLLQLWEKQIQQHLVPDTVALCIYHGPTRSSDLFHSSDIVLTTYNVVAKEWKASRKCFKSTELPPIYATSWRRIVLDEAHIIKNRATDIARAVCALHGVRRWCITGTPVQNRSLDIYSLLRFLKVYPFDDHKTFEATFVNPWISFADESALRKLQILVSTISIRRPRATIELPHREESVRQVEFTHEEHKLYADAKGGVFQTIDNAISGTSDQNRGASYLNALQKINDLRYICNHGIQPRPRKVTSHSLKDEDEETLVYRELGAMFANDAETSSVCGACGFDLLDSHEEENEFLTVDYNLKQDLSRDTCPNCGVKTCINQTTTSWMSCLPSNSNPGSPCTKHSTSSKIQALLREIQQIQVDEKCVIFSYWTSTLKAIGQALEDEGICFLLYDGSLTRAKRDSTLNSFANDNKFKALLVSITCGGQGLDLTVANHAFIFEPQWNPMLEEQAMARVHRLGQTKPVRLIRLIVRNTWEEKIVTLQKRKRLLADLIVDSKKIERGDQARQQLLWLRDLVS